MSIDWNKMSPREMWEALEKMPKVAGPWMLDEVRLQYKGDGWVEIVAQGTDGVYTYSESMDTYSSRAEIDEIMRSDGWILVEENE